MTTRSGWTCSGRRAVPGGGADRPRLAASSGGGAAAPSRCPSGSRRPGSTPTPARSPSIRANRPFAPQYPLWSDGAAKRRWVWLPDGAAIDTRDLDHWDFPVGTRFWKEFEFGGRRVETRLLVKTARRSLGVRARYAWNEDQTDAMLAPAERPRRRRRGRARQVAQHPVARGVPRLPRLGPHRDPRLHRAAALGPTAIRCAPHAEALAPGMVTLADARGRGAAVPGRGRSWSRRRRASPPRSPRERAALGYLSTNCGSCHNPKSIDRVARPVPAARRPTGRPACAPTPIATTRRPAGPLGGAVGAGRHLADRARRAAGAERPADAGEVAPAVEPDAADRHGGRRSRGAGTAERLDRRRAGRLARATCAHAAPRR